MSKTISANISEDENNRIEQYCKNNKISKNNLTKNSIRNTINQNTPSGQDQLLETDTIQKTKNIQTDIISESVKEINAKNKIRKEIEPRIKEQSHREFLEHLKSKTNCCPNCEICNIKNNIENILMKKQEEKLVSLYNQYNNQFKERELNSHLTGIQNGMKLMMANPNEDPKKAYQFYLDKFVKPTITN